MGYHLARRRVIARLDHGILHLLADDEAYIVATAMARSRKLGAYAVHPDVLAAQRRERVRIRSERQQRGGRPRAKAT